MVLILCIINSQTCCCLFAQPTIFEFSGNIHINIPITHKPYVGYTIHRLGKYTVHHSSSKEHGAKQINMHILLVLCQIMARMFNSVPIKVVKLYCRLPFENPNLFVGLIYSLVIIIGLKSLVTSYC